MTLQFWDRSESPMMCTVLPEQQIENWRIIHKTIDKATANRAATRMMVSNGARGGLRPGDTYAIVYENDSVWMSDTPDERRDHSWAIYQAKGHCLVGGLGLGMVALAMALKSDVKSVDVVEINPQVVQLIEPHLQQALTAAGCAGKLRVITANLLDWKPPKGRQWDTIWFDIWPDLCTDDLAMHATLNRRYARRTKPGGYRGCWGNEYLKHQRDQERRSGW